MLHHQIEIQGLKGQLALMLAAFITAAREHRDLTALDLSQIALQYQRCLSNLRAKGFRIEKVRDERVHGVRYCAYRLIMNSATTPQKTAPSLYAQPTNSAEAQPPLITLTPAWADPETEAIR